MSFNIEDVIEAFAMMSLWEIGAVVLGVIYIVLATKELAWAWVFGFFSTLIYTILFWEGALVSSALLNFYYMGMAIYGFLLWRKKEDTPELKISSWSLSKNSIVIILGLVVSVVVGYLSQTYAEAKSAYLDAFVLVFSIIATWMMAQKILQNWLYWIVIDSFAIILYLKSGYYATIVLFVIYISLSIYGYRAWMKSYKEREE